MNARDTELPGEHDSLWLATTEATDYQRLEEAITADVAVVGGGIVGLTAAVDLAEAGADVALVEADRIVEGVTGHTTAKLTAQHGLVYDRLESQFGPAAARQYAEANQGAVEAVAARVDRDDVDCDLRRVPAYTYVRPGDDDGPVRDEVAAARRAGLPADYEPDPPLPYDAGPAVRFDDQAVFHPRKYLLALAGALADAGGRIYERTRAEELQAGRRSRVVTGDGAVTADSVLVTSHFPAFDRGFFYARTYPKQSHVLAVEIAGEPPEGAFYRTGDPYFSVRTHPADDRPLVLVGGENHRTGHPDSTAERFRRLERAARERFDVEAVRYRWTTQDYVSIDGVPFVGRLSPSSEGVYVATGFGGWGMSNGVAAGEHLAERALGRKPPWGEVFSPTRLKPFAGGREFVEQGLHVGRHYLRDWLDPPAVRAVADVGPGEADVMTVGGERLAVARDDDGALHAVSAVCTHMGCLVAWNDAEGTWDCPCHGSRFDRDGAVIDGPAGDGLPPADQVGSSAGRESGPSDRGPHSGGEPAADRE